MKIIFFSDIHGIKTNLNKLENVINKENPEKIVVLGDLYYNGFDKNDAFDNKFVFDFLNKYQDKLIVTKGNCDSDVDIKASDFPMCNLGLINTDGIDIYITHGNEFNYDKNRKFTRRGVLVYGHEHIPYIRKKDDMIYICVGSISLPRNDFGATYMIYENNKFIIYNIDGNIIDELSVL